METGIVEYSVTDAAISEMASLYMGLTITDIEDKEQFNDVKSARLVVKGKRVEVEKRRKELKADALEWGKKVDTEAKRIFAKLEPIETHLQKEEDKVVEAERLRKEEAEQRERERVQGMVDELGKYGHTVAFHDAQTMPWNDYLELLEWTKATHAEAQRKAEEERQARETEAKRLIAEREELERLRKEQADKDRIEREKIQAEQLKIAQEHAAIQAEKRAFEAEKARIAREEQANRDAEAAKIEAERLAKLAAEKAENDRIAAEKAEADRLARAEQMKPDREKLLAWIANFNYAFLPTPIVESEEAKEILRIALGQIEVVLQDMQTKAEAL